MTDKSLPPLSWLDYSRNTLADMVVASDKASVNDVTAWLLSNPRDVGDMDAVSVEQMAAFIALVQQCSPLATDAYELPCQWSARSIDKTQVFREMMLNVEIWRYKATPEKNDEREMDFTQLLYPTEAAKAILSTGIYSPNVEASRLYLGMAPNALWWNRLPLWGMPEIDKYTRSLGWEYLRRELTSCPHAEQGLRIALASMRETNSGSPTKSSVLQSPSVPQIIASNVEGKMPLALWQALHCSRDNIPDPAWWQHWDAWVQEKPEQAQLSLTSLFLAKIYGLQSDLGSRVLRTSLIRLVSLRDPPATFSIANLALETKKYDHLSMDALLEKTLPIPNRTLCLFESLDAYRNQLLLHYQKLYAVAPIDIALPHDFSTNILVR